MNAAEFQVRLFERIKAKLPQEIKFTEEIKSALGVSLNSAYRKIRGETQLPMEEIIFLADRYQISLDECMANESSDTLLFRRRNTVSNLDEFKAYIIHTQGQLAALRNMPEANLFYSARDLPLFFYFRYPALAAFKILVWMKDTDPSLSSHNRLSLDMVPADIIDEAKQLNKLYFELPTTEFWTTRTIANMLEQIRYYASGLLSEEDIARIFEDLEKVIDEREKRAAGQFDEGVNVRSDLYWCNFLMIANGALASVKDLRIGFVAFSGINFIQTFDPGFCRQMDEAFRAHLRQGIIISGSAEKERAQFFNILRKNMEKTRQLCKQFAEDI